MTSDAECCLGPLQQLHLDGAKQKDSEEPALLPSPPPAHTKDKDSGTTSADEADDSTCAICLNRIPPSQTAQPVGCDHVYCTCCILHWACFKDKPWCPQCKTPFQSLLTFRTLDGELHDYPCQEPIALLRCTSWFQDHVKMRERAAAASDRPRPPLQGSVIDESDYLDYARYYQEYDDDEEVEDYYFSSAAGRARVVIGNRRHGPNGYLSAGRMQARPAPQPTAKGASTKGRASTGSCSTPQRPVKNKEAGKPRTPASAPPASRASGSGSGKKKKPSIRLDTDDESDTGGPSTKHSVGRRARRNQRRAAADARLEL